MAAVTHPGCQVGGQEGSHDMRGGGAGSCSSASPAPHTCTHPSPCHTPWTTHTGMRPTSAVTHRLCWHRQGGSIPRPWMLRLQRHSSQLAQALAPC